MFKFDATFFCALSLVRITCATVEDKAYWQKLGHEDLQQSLEQSTNNGVAKNVILFVGDGMGPTTVTASRIYGKGERGYLVFERFPHLGVLKTYSSNKIVPDSCSTATALFCGVKANQRTCGVDHTVQKGDCKASLKDSAQMESIVQWAQNAGKSTGFVTTTRVTHATPSALYSHTANRYWECEATKPENAARCKDIARQLIEDLPGRNLKVIMGGGRQCMQSNVRNSSTDPIDTWACYSKDGRDLIKYWEKEKQDRQASYKVVANNRELQNLDVNAEYVLGVFANGHLKMDYERDKGPSGMPSLSNMTEKAIQVLMKDANGFLLVVEGGLIDHAHHRGHAKQALDETVAFNDAIAKALDLTENSAHETLIVVTSDHSHSLVFPGYSDRGNSLLGIAQESKMDSIPYTSLLYGTGGPNNFQYMSINNTVVRPNPATQITEDFQYSQQAAVLTDEVTHDGTDVHVYAKGPMAHLFQRVHEQTYVAYVISYAARIGPFEFSRNSAHVVHGSPATIVLSVLYCVLLKTLAK